MEQNDIDEIIEEYGDVLSEALVRRVIDSVNNITEAERQTLQEKLQTESFEAKPLIQNMLSRYVQVVTDYPDDSKEEVIKLLDAGLSDAITTTNDGTEFLNPNTFLTGLRNAANVIQQTDFQGSNVQAAMTADAEAVDPTLGTFDPGFGTEFEGDAAIAYTVADLTAHVARYEEDVQNELAMELALNGFYGENNYDDVFDDEGNLNLKEFQDAVSQAIRYAQNASPEGIKIEGLAGQPIQFLGGTNIPLFFNILTRQTGLSSEEIQKQFDEALETVDDSVVRYIDKYSIYESMNTASMNLLGREATKPEKDILLNMIYDLKESKTSPLQIDVDARARASITEGTLGNVTDAGLDALGRAGIDVDPQTAANKDVIQGEYQANRKAQIAGSLLRLMTGARG
tara:strand:+ start:1909 stop:3105 length:1197 start_codon:yes stop_codon:yes gene_type:complete